MDGTRRELDGNVWRETISETPRKRKYLFEVDGNGQATGETRWPEAKIKKLPTMVPAEPLRSHCRQLRKEKASMVHIFSGPSGRSDGVAANAKRFDITCTDFDTENGPSQNVLLRQNRDWILDGIRAKLIKGAIIGTPCNTFSVARFERNGGPDVLRTRGWLRGRPGLNADDRAKLELSEELVRFTVEVCLALHAAGGAFIIENPTDHGDENDPEHYFGWLMVRASPSTHAHHRRRRLTAGVAAACCVRVLSPSCAGSSGPRRSPRAALAAPRDPEAAGAHRRPHCHV